MSSALLPRLRLVSFGVVSLFSLVVLGLSAHLINLTTTYYGVYFTFAALGTATSLLSLLSLPAVIYIDNIRKGAFTSKIATELGLVGFLWILWLATAATATDTVGINLGSNCGRYKPGSRIRTACSETSAVQAFGYLSWLILLAYFSALLFFTAAAAVRGHKDIWFHSVKEADFNFASAPPTAAAAPAVEKPQPQYDPTIAQNTGASQQQHSQGSPAPGWAGQPAQPPPAASYPQV
ncbi:hypothetical protein DXG03_005307 [Asterophora parasitica]|uniref:MARVEL domain-containing protein n=1 Tax=Asterophora parasitica TaxID=117018 RepID=A0A9P7GAH1_9AGAR|nr:hypothetical protein DXG03_005307 [Asterophora parasitica]